MKIATNLANIQNNQNHTVIKLAKVSNTIREKMALDNYKGKNTIVNNAMVEEYRDTLAKISKVAPKINEPERSLVEENAFLFGKSDYLYIYPELIDALLAEGLIEDLGSALSINYYGLFDKLLIEIAKNEYIITDRHLYTRTGEVLDLSVVLKKYALYNNYAKKNKRHQVKLPKREEYVEYFQYAKTISLTRLLVVLMENGDILSNNIIDRRYISSDFEVHHAGMTWCNFLSKLIYMPEEEHRYLSHQEKHREQRRIIRNGVDMIRMMQVACAA